MNLLGCVSARGERGQRWFKEVYSIHGVGTISHLFTTNDTLDFISFHAPEINSTKLKEFMQNS